MKAEIAKEMIRSRTQTPIPVPGRIGAAGVASGAPADRAGAVVRATELESEDVSGMFPYCIQITGARQRFALERPPTRT
jgi:hypothetical protein